MFRQFGTTYYNLDTIRQIVPLGEDNYEIWFTDGDRVNLYRAGNPDACTAIDGLLQLVRVEATAERMAKATELIQLAELERGR